MGSEIDIRTGFAQRVDQACGGIASLAETAKLLRTSKGRLQKILAGADEPTPEEQLKIAGLCRVDPRWLITGRVSPAAAAALAVFDLEHFRTLKQTPPDKLWIFARIRNALEMLVQPEIEPGRCRYCACTEFAACELGCAWVDREQTICDACLWPPGISP